MRMSKTHKVAVTAVVTTIATASVLTFTRGDTAPADHIASLPKASNDAPVVAPHTPDAKRKPKPTATTPEPTQPTTPAPKPVEKTSDKPSPTTKPAPTTDPTPSPTPTHRTLLDILLGK